MDIRIQSVVVDAADCERLARFWSDALGWRITHESPDEWVIEPPEGSAEADVAPDILFLKVPDSKTVKNRLHFDLRPSDQEAQVNRLTGLGASKVNIGQPDDVTWVVMADPEGTSSACSPLCQRLRTDCVLPVGEPPSGLSVYG